MESLKDRIDHAVNGAERCGCWSNALEAIHQEVERLMRTAVEDAAMAARDMALDLRASDEVGSAVSMAAMRTYTGPEYVM